MVAIPSASLLLMESDRLPVPRSGRAMGPRTTGLPPIQLIRHATARPVASSPASIDVPQITPPLLIRDALLRSCPGSGGRTIGWASGEDQYSAGIAPVEESIPWPAISPKSLMAIAEDISPRNNRSVD